MLRPSRERTNTRLVALGLAVGVLMVRTPAGVGAQVRIDLDTLETCRTCELILTELAVLGGRGSEPDEGDPVGRELLIGPDASVFLVPHRTGTSVQVYDAEGLFLYSFGSRGEGPGEFQSIASTFLRDSLLYVADSRRRRMVVVGLEGQYVHENVFPHVGTQFVIMDTQHAVAAADDRHPSRVGFPLHIVHLPTGSVLNSTGSPDGRYAPASRLDVQYRLSTDPDGDRAVWLGRRSELRFEKWDVWDGTLQTIVSGEPGWFPRAERDFDGRTEPPTTLSQFLVDGDGRIWVLTQVAHPHWRDHVVLDPDGVHSWGVDDPASLWDTQLHLFDLRSGRHVQGPMWPEVAVGLTMDDDGTPLVYRQVMDQYALTTRLYIYRVEVQEDGPS